MNATPSSFSSSQSDAACPAQSTAAPAAPADEAAPQFSPSTAPSTTPGRTLRGGKTRFTVRRLDLSDSAAYRACRLRGLFEYPDAFTSSFEEENARPVAYTDARLDPAGNRKIWGAFIDGELVGMIGLEPQMREKNRHKALLTGMFVSAEHAGRGLGRALIQTLVDEARSTGIELIVLTVTDNNRPAIGLYRKAGFASFGIEPDAIRIDGVSLDKAHMYLALASTAAAADPDWVSP